MKTLTSGRTRRELSVKIKCVVNPTDHWLIWRNKYSLQQLVEIDRSKKRVRLDVGNTGRSGTCNMSSEHMHL